MRKLDNTNIVVDQNDDNIYLGYEKVIRCINFCDQKVYSSDNAKKIIEYILIENF